MKKSNTCRQSSGRQRKSVAESVTIGMDLGDKMSRCCTLNSSGEVVEEERVATTKQGMTQAFGTRKRSRIAMEVGTHSPWVSRLLSRFGHEVIVANARQVRLISQSSRKDDRMDARSLARLARADPELLRPVRHRSEEAQQDLAKIRIRAALIEARTALVNAGRGMVKAFGERLPKCDADQMSWERSEDLPVGLRETLKPLLKQVESLSEQIRECDEEIEEMGRRKYPEIAVLQQVSGVGTLIALTFVLTLEDKERFQKSRDVGCYLGLRPKRSQSGESEPQLGISKEGDVYLRKLLVQGAHYILGWRGPDTDLRRWGMKLAARGGKNAKKRALVAVARKLAVLLHRLWVTGEVYQPLRRAQGVAA